jgi:hypothetical protein
MESRDGLKEILSELQAPLDDFSEFLCTVLRCWPIERTDADRIIRDFLANDDQRRRMFEHLSPSALEKFISFLVDWQLLQEDEWVVRLPHVFAYECTNATDPERREMLLVATMISSLASDIASPVVRLLSGPHRLENIALIDKWRQTARLIGHNSEPWLAARIRGFLGTIDYVA